MKSGVVYNRQYLIYLQDDYLFSFHSFTKEGTIHPLKKRLDLGYKEVIPKEYC